MISDRLLRARRTKGRRISLDALMREDERVGDLCQHIELFYLQGKRRHVSQRVAEADHLRQQSKQRASANEGALHQAAERAAARNPEEVMIDATLALTLVEEFTKSLTPTENLLVMCVKGYGMSERHVAKHLLVSRQFVSKTVERAVRKIFKVGVAKNSSKSVWESTERGITRRESKDVGAL